MDRAAYAYQVFRQHYDSCCFARRDGGFVALELGPGDGLLSAVIAASFGAARCYLVDSGCYANPNPAPYHEIAEFLRGLSLRPPDLTGAQDLHEILRRCNAVYLTDGLNSLKQLPGESVDLTWSHAVLEHVRRREFPETQRELCRLMTHDGRASHQVDLQDHLGGGLDNLRFPSRWWEAEWMARSGFYTNRIQFGQMLQIFAESGLQAERMTTEQFRSLPIKTRALAAEFRHIPDADLMVRSFHVVLKRF
jgi:hypothetical protein